MAKLFETIYDGKKFHNLVNTPLFGSYTDPFSERRENGPASPKQKFVFPEFHYQLPAKKSLQLSWFGHSSVLLTMNHCTILFDPCFSSYASPLSFAGPKRYIGKNISVEQLPQIDLVVLSHCHYDHMDKKTLKELNPKTKHFLVPLKVKKMLVRFGIKEEKITETGWGETFTLNDISVLCTPTQHGSNRTGFDAEESLWCSYLLHDNDYTVFFSGDGGYGEHFKTIGSIYKKIDLALLECGQYNVRWHGYHCFPEESVQAALDLKAELAVPIHYGAYNLSDHYYLEPAHRFEARAQKLGLSYKIMGINETIEIQSD